MVSISLPSIATPSAALAAAVLAMVALTAAAMPASAAMIDGVWQSPKDEDGSYLTVRVQPCERAGEERCAIVTGAHHGAKREAVGLQVMRVEPKSDGSWEGEIIQPLSGDVYDSNIRLLRHDLLHVDGCVLAGLFCRTQEWKRFD